MEVQFIISASTYEEHPKRDKKGKSLIQFPQSYVVLDIETTGLSPEYNSIIEVAAIRIDNGRQIDTFSALVKPEENYFEDEDEPEQYDWVVNDDGGKVYYVDRFIAGLTGITNEMLNDAEKIDKVLPRLNNFIGSSIVIGYNVNFDINFIYDNYLENLGVPFGNDFIDVMRIVKKFLTELSHHRLSDIVEYYSLDGSGSHRALKDCDLTQQAFVKIKDEIIKKFGSTEQFINDWKSKYNQNVNKIRAKNIVPTTSDIDITHPLYGKRCVFTGVLEKMIRKDAMQIVANFGGLNDDNVTAKTNYLILGNNDYCTTIKGGKSTKHKKAELYKMKGSDIEIIPENVFYDMINY